MNTSHCAVHLATAFSRSSVHILIANMLSIIMFVYVHSEVSDAMFQPSRYDTVYPYNYLYNYFVTVPFSS